MDEWRHKEDRMHSGLQNLFSTQREAGLCIWVILEDLVTAQRHPTRSLYKEGLCIQKIIDQTLDKCTNSVPLTLSRPSSPLREHGLRDQGTHHSSPPLKISSILLKIVTHLQKCKRFPLHLHISVSMSCIIRLDDSLTELRTLFVLQWLFRILVWLSYVLVFSLWSWNRRRTVNWLSSDLYMELNFGF